MRLGFLEDDRDPFEEGVAILVIFKDFSSFYPPGHDVLEKARGVNAGLSWYRLWIENISGKSTFFIRSSNAYSKMNGFFPWDLIG